MPHWKTSLFALSLLAACGGGGDSSSPGGGSGGTASQQKTFNQLDNIRDDFESRYNYATTTNFADATLPTTLPSSGSFTYNGVIGARLPQPVGDLEVLGDLQLNMNFSSDTFSGTAQNFIDENSDTYSGILGIRNGDIDNNVNIATDYTFVADINGTLVDNVNDVYIIDGDILGDFYGPNYDWVAGRVDGTIDTPGGIVPLNDTNSVFAASR